MPVILSALPKMVTPPPDPPAPPVEPLALIVPAATVTVPELAPLALSVTLPPPPLLAVTFRLVGLVMVTPPLEPPDPAVGDTYRSTSCACSRRASLHTIGDSGRIDCEGSG